MEIILQEDFPSLGYIGDKVNVRRGYARNYLIPRGIAVESLSRNARILKHRLHAIDAKRAKKKAEAEVAAKRLEEISLEFTIKLAESGKSFGSITARDIESALKEKGLEVDRKQIKISDAFKTAGSYTIQVKLHSEVSANIPVTILAEKKAVAPLRDEKGTSPEKEEKKRGGRGKKASAEASEETVSDA